MISAFYTTQALNLTATSLLASSGMTRRYFIGVAAAGLGSALIPSCGSDPSTGGTDGGTTDAGTDSGTDGGTTTLPNNFTVEDLATFNCQFAPDIDLGGSGILGLCTSEANELFQFDPSQTPSPVAAEALLDFGAIGNRTLNQLAATREGKGVVTTDEFGAQSGIYELNLDGSGVPRLILFPAGNNYAGGPSFAQGKLFIPTANADDSVFPLTYGVGSLQVFDVSPAGLINDSSRRELQTSALNPTSTAVIGDNTLLVLNSGDFTASSQAVLDIFDITNEILTTSIPLGNLTAQVGGEISVSADGRYALIGSAAFADTDPWAGRVLRVDLVEGTVEQLTASGTTFHSSAKMGDGIAYVSDFNSGRITVLDLAAFSIHRTVEIAGGLLGPAEISAGSLVQVIAGGAVLVTPED